MDYSEADEIISIGDIGMDRKNNTDKNSNIRSTSSSTKDSTATTSLIFSIIGFTSLFCIPFLSFIFFLVSFIISLRKLFKNRSAVEPMHYIALTIDLIGTFIMMCIYALFLMVFIGASTGT